MPSCMAKFGRFKFSLELCSQVFRDFGSINGFSSLDGGERLFGRWLQLLLVREELKSTTINTTGT